MLFCTEPDGTSNVELLTKERPKTGAVGHTRATACSPGRKRTNNIDLEQTTSIWKVRDTSDGRALKAAAEGVLRALSIAHHPVAGRVSRVMAHYYFEIACSKDLFTDDVPEEFE